jgi:cell division protein ZapE
MSLTENYMARIAAGSLVADAQQERLAQRLDALSRALNVGLPRDVGYFGKLFGKIIQQPRGLYIYGEVGRGKTMLMDLLYESVSGWPKRRIHFHAFMQEVHKARAQQKTIEQMADGIVATARLLCLDEMQVTDIADAMIVGRLYEAMQQRGVVLVTTANVPPSGLYRDGLSRDLFLPFIAKLEASLDVVSLDSTRDYRLGRLQARPTYLWPLNVGTTEAFQSDWDDLTDGSEGEPVSLDVLGRKLVVPRVAHGCAWFSFAELCEQPLGPADYLAIAQNFSTVFVDGIPALSKDQRNESRRFVLLVDTLYDLHRHIVIRAAVPAEKICVSGKHGFEFKRTVSRLQEMQAMSWWQDEKA